MSSTGGAEWGMFVVLTFFMVVAAIIVPMVQGEFGFATDVPGEGFTPGDVSSTSLMSLGSSLWSMFSPIWSYFTLLPGWVILIHFVIKIIWYILLLRLIILPIVEAVGGWIPFT